MTRRALAPTRLAVGGAAALVLALSGCGVQDSLVGLHPAPPEKSASAPLDAEGAAAVATRLVTQASVVAAEKGAEGDAARAAVMAGDALTVANAAAARGAAQAPATDLERAAEPTVVAQSQGRDWPRAILAATLDPATNTQYLHVMLSPTATDPFRIVAQAPMLPGTELPALSEASQGAPLIGVDDTDGMARSAGESVTAYAAALAYPTPKASDAVAVDDPFATALRTSATAQTKALGALGSFSQSHAPALENAVTFRLADGGAVTFTLMRRTDSYTAAAGAKELTLPADLAALAQKQTVTKSAQFESLEPLAMVVPATSGPSVAIGASDLLISGKGQ